MQEKDLGSTQSRTWGLGDQWNRLIGRALRFTNNYPARHYAGMDPHGSMFPVRPRGCRDTVIVAGRPEGPVAKLEPFVKVTALQY